MAIRTPSSAAPSARLRPASRRLGAKDPARDASTSKATQKTSNATVNVAEHFENGQAEQAKRKLTLGAKKSVSSAQSAPTGAGSRGGLSGFLAFAKKPLKRVARAGVAGMVIASMMLGGCASTGMLGLQTAHAGTLTSMQQTLPDVGRPLRANALRAALVKETAPTQAASLQSEISVSAQALLPTDIQNLSPMAALAAVHDGVATFSIPVKAGKIDLKGTEFTAKPGTVLHVKVQVQDGKLVPSDQDGTVANFSPALRGPVWVKGGGLTAARSDGGQLVLKFELSGWKDAQVLRAPSLDFADLVHSLESKMGPSTSGSSSQQTTTTPSALDAFDLDAMQMDLTGVQLAAGQVDMGGMQLDLAAGNTWRASYDHGAMRIRGQVHLNGLNATGADFALNAGGVDVQLDVQTRPLPGGLKQMNTAIRGLDAHVNALSLGTSQGDHLALRNVDVQGDFQATSLLGTAGHHNVLSTSHQLTVSGELRPSQLTVPDDNGNAQVQLAAQHFAGKSVSSHGKSSFSGEVTGSRVKITGLQTAGIDLHHASVNGSGHVRMDEAGTFSASIDASRVDVRIDDLVNQSGQTHVDLGRTEIAGTGHLNFSSNGSLSLNGNLTLSGHIDDLVVNDAGGLSSTSPGLSQFDLGPSALQGSLRSLQVNRAGVSLDARNLDVNLGVDALAVRMPGFMAQGSGALSGHANLSIDHGVSLDGALSLQLDVTDGSIAPSGDALSLDMGQGTSMHLNLRQAGAGNGQVSLQLGAGSQVKVLLDGGHYQDGSHRVDFLPGTAATFDASKLVTNGKTVSLQGALQVHGHARVDGLQTAESITVDDVQLNANGNFSLNGVNVLLAAQSQEVTSATSDVNALLQNAQQSIARVQQRSAPSGALSVQQVQQTDALQMIGLTPSAQAVDPLHILSKVQDGKVQVQIPVSGTTHGVTFAPGTTLNLSAVISGGKIVPDQFHAQFSQPGDGPLWVTANGAYLDDNNTLRLDLGGWYDHAVGDQFSNLPLDVAGLLARIMDNGGTSSGASSTDATPFDLAATTFTVSDVHFAAGELPIPGGALTVGPTNSFQLNGNTQNARLTGTIDVQELAIGAESVALQGSGGTGTLQVDYQMQPDALSANLQLSGLNAHIGALAYRTETGAYLHLANGQATGDLSLQMTVPVDSNGHLGTPHMIPSLHFDHYQGRIEGARFTTESDTSPLNIEFAQSTVQGELTIENGQLTNIDAQVQQVDVVVQSRTQHVVGQDVSLDYGHVRGSGHLSYTPAGLSIDHAQVHLDAVVSAADANGLNVDGVVQNVSVQGAQAVVSLDVDALNELNISDTSAVNWQLGGHAAGAVALSAQSILGTFGGTPSR